jgi:hypothetical protein
MDCFSGFQVTDLHLFCSRVRTLAWKLENINSELYFMWSQVGAALHVDPPVATGKEIRACFCS